MPVRWLSHHDGVPFVVVIGDREIRDATLAVRGRDGRWTRATGDAIGELARRCGVAGEIARTSQAPGAAL